MDAFSKWLMNGLRGALEELNLSGLGKLINYFKSGKNSEVTKTLQVLSGKETALDNKDAIDIAANALGKICGINCIATAASCVVDLVASFMYGSGSLVGLGIVDVLSVFFSGAIGIAISVAIYYLITYVFRTFEHKKIRFDTLNVINILLIVFMAINIGSQVLSIAGSGLISMIGIIGFGVTAILSIVSICISIYSSLATLGVYSYIFEGLHDYIMRNKSSIETGIGDRDDYFNGNGFDR